LRTTDRRHCGRPYERCSMHLRTLGIEFLCLCRWSTGGVWTYEYSYTFGTPSPGSPALDTDGPDYYCRRRSMPFRSDVLSEAQSAGSKTSRSTGCIFSGWLRRNNGDSYTASSPLRSETLSKFRASYQSSSEVTVKT